MSKEERKFQVGDRVKTIFLDRFGIITEILSKTEVRVGWEKHDYMSATEEGYLMCCLELIIPEEFLDFQERMRERIEDVL